MQIVFGSILAISLLLAINFSGRIAAGRSIEANRDDLESSIKALEAQATALKSELNYINSNDFIEHWARSEGKMVKGDEYLVIPVPGMTTPEPVATAMINIPVSEQNPDSQNWKLWWQLFFDNPPPSDNN
jgi:cell division protein FtsB